jgi:sulfur carrier protein
MTLIVNGAELQLDVATLAAALQALDYGDAVVATALNGQFVAARARAATPLAEGDRTETVSSRQGG